MPYCVTKGQSAQEWLRLPSVSLRWRQRSSSHGWVMDRNTPTPPSVPPVLPPGVHVSVKTEPVASEAEKARETTLGGVVKKKFSPKAPAPKPQKPTPSPKEGQDGTGGGGGEAKGGKSDKERRREGKWREREGSDRGGRGARGRGRGRGGNYQQPMGQVYFSGDAAAVVPPPRAPVREPRPIDLSKEPAKPSAGSSEGVGLDGGGKEGASGGGGGGGGGGESGDGAVTKKKGWMAVRPGLEAYRDEEDEEDDWMAESSPRGGDRDDDEDDEMQVDTWPPPVVNKMEPISVHFGPSTEEARQAHEEKLARVFSDGTNVDEEEQDFIFIQLPRRIPMLDEPGAAGPPAPPAQTPAAPMVAVKPEGDSSATGGGGSSSKGAETPGDGGANPGGGTADPPVVVKTENGLNKMRSGYLGKMYVHASGKVTFAMGDAVMYEVQPGLPCYFAQDVVSMSSDDASFCVLGSVRKKLVCVPNLDQEFSGVLR